MNKRLSIIILYWFLVSLGISTLIKPSFSDFWLSWFIALIITPGSIFLYYGYKLIQEHKSLRFFVRFFLLVLTPVLWAYLTIFIAFWYSIQIQAVYIPIVLVNPIFLGIILGFFAFVYQQLDQKFKIEQKPIPSTIQIFSNRVKTTLVVSEISYIESRSDHTIVHMKNGNSFRNSLSISSWNNNLSEFIRIHRSFLVNPAQCILKGSVVQIGEEELPVSRTYRTSINEFYKTNEQIT